MMQVLKSLSLPGGVVIRLERSASCYRIISTVGGRVADGVVELPLDCDAADLDHFWQDAVRWGRVWSRQRSAAGYRAPVSRGTGGGRVRLFGIN